MKRTFLMLVVIALVLFELLLCTGFLPSEWQRTMDGKIPKILPGTQQVQTSVNHPTLDREIQNGLRKDLRLQFGLYVVLALLLSINALLIRLVWRRLFRRSTISATRL